MKITTLGLIQAVKNVGVFLSTFLIMDIQADPTKFIYAFIIYACISIPSDLYLLNKAHEDTKK